MAIERSDEFYGDAGGMEGEAPVQEEMADADMPTTLVPKSMLMGQDVGVGDVIKLRVTGLMDDDVEVTYAEEEESEPEPEMMMEAPMGGGMDEMLG